jgi:hypothetical protein
MAKFFAKETMWIEQKRYFYCFFLIMKHVFSILFNLASLILFVHVHYQRSCFPRPRAPRSKSRRRPPPTVRMRLPLAWMPLRMPLIPPVLVPLALTVELPL